MNPFENTGGSTNPFEDSGGRMSTGKIDTNPFNVSNNSFDDEMEATMTDGGEEDYTVDEDPNESLVPTDAPVEASWQYLGDLPYRRVPIYNNVRWGASDKSKSESGQTDGGADASAEVINYGISAFPKAAIQRHPDLMNPRELRELLDTSTVTKVR